MLRKNYKYHHTDALTPRQLVDMQMAYEYRMLKEESARSDTIAVPKSTGQQTDITAIRHGLEQHGILDRRTQIDFSFKKHKYKKKCDDELARVK